MRLAEGHIPWPRRAPTKPPARFEVTCDGTGVVGHAGAALLVELADRLGLTRALGWRAGRAQTSRHRHDAGTVLRDLAVLLADGDDCLSDLAVLRQQPELFGPIASTPTAWRVIEQVACAPDGLAGLRAARAHARAATWRVGAHVDGLLVVDVDGTLVDAHSDKQGAAGTYKGGFGFYPLVCYLDRGDGTGEALAGILRPGNAGSNSGQDHIEVIDLALAQLPSAARDQPLLVRADTGGATHALTERLRQRGVRFSVGLPADERVRAAVLAVPQAPGSPRSTVTASPAQAPRSPSWRPWTLRAGRRAPGRSAAAKTPPRRSAQFHRRRRASLPGLHHRPARPRCGHVGAASPPPRPRRGPYPLRQGHRAAQPALRPAAPQPGLAGTGAHRPRTCSAGRRCCCWTATSRSPSPRPCATGCCTWPPAWSATPAA